MKKKKQTPYRILRLKSGQDVIARISGRKDGKIILERPMQMKVSSILEGGFQREFLVFRNWMEYVKGDDIKIPAEWVASFLVPEDDVAKMYDAEKGKEDLVQAQLKKISECKDPIEKLLLMRELMSLGGGDSPFEEDSKPNIQDLIEPDYIMVNLAIPPDVFFQMISQGMLDNFDFESIMGDSSGKLQPPAQEEIWEEPTDKDDPEFGKSWKDWSPNPEDYL